MFGQWTVAQSENKKELPRWHPLQLERVADVRETPLPTLSEAFYNRLSRAHKLLDEDRSTEALDLMDRISPDRIGKYEAALLFQTYGFVYSQLGREDEAFDAWLASLELDALPTFVQQGIAYSVAGYYASNERYEESNATLLRWFRYESDPIAEAYILMGANFAQSEKLRAALPYVEKANRLSEEPDKNWRNMQLSIHVGLEQFDAAIELLKENVGIWPDDVRNYVALSSLYAEIGNDEAALAALSVPWQRGILESQAEIINLVRLNLLLANPARAASILSDAIDREHVEKTPAHLRILLDSWTLARENTRAVETIDMLARVTDEGDVFYRKALLLNESGQWAEVVESCQQALDRGSLSRPGEVWLLQGVALTELGHFNNAIEAFQNAKRSGDDRVHRDANEWIGYVRERIHGSS